MANAEYVPIARRYMDRETNIEFCSIVEWARWKGTVTLNQDYTGSVEEIEQGQTLFKELTIAPLQVPKQIRKLVGKNGPGENDVKKVTKALYTVLEKEWRSDMFHLVVHSSGYDSRIISQAIVDLGHRKRKKYLHDVLFICMQPEAQQFKQIMEHEGWPKEQYMVANEDAPTHEYYAGVVDLDDFWRWTNDAQPWVWIVHHVAEQLSNEGKLPPLSEVQYIDGYTGNEGFKFTTEKLIRFFYYHRWGARHCVLPYGSVLRPFAHYEVLKLTSKKNKHEKAFFRLTRRRFTPWARNLQARQMIISYLDPRLLDIPRHNGEDGNTPHRRLSERLRERCLEQYNSSWYGKQFPAYEAPEVLWLQGWWTEYAKASICEEITKRGGTILIGDE